MKTANEITLRIRGDWPQFFRALEAKGFRETGRFSMRDAYFIPGALPLAAMTSRQILAAAVLVREIRRGGSGGVTKRLTFKRKEIAPDGQILSQAACNCEVLSVREAGAFLEALGYRRVMTVSEEDTLFQKDGFEIACKDVSGGEALIEVETSAAFPSVESLKERLAALDLPLDISDYFVKKAELALDRTLGR